MLKTESLPSLQEAKNNRLSAEVRTLFIAGVIILVSCIAGFAALVFVGPDVQAHNSELVSGDGSMVGFAAIVGLNLAVADGATPAHVKIRLPDRKLVDAVKIETENFNGASLALLRASEQFPDAVVPALGSEPSGSLHAITPNGPWTGAAQSDVKNGPWHLEPESGLTPATPIYQDQLLVGVTAEAGSRLILVPVRELTAKFKEISKGE